ncbi:3-methyl-2-oxobutanoate dehydrogenase subunit beta [Candidatus Borrarchaeum sp.]|uniref:3-methyl-2-oxobutanoate dehydrogenase subunit beta n=1 Tax=Candidatus Borrarchaeum sp. TaxID=2846742 RepID=UPI002580D452|nr:3-methyl-2-oxobutanoate dehydrogenase subunit beta [Candidatus Borrarchaeum sp.]
MGVKTIIPEEEFILGGNRACPGCGAVVALRTVAKALGKDVILVIPASCATIISGKFPATPFKFPVLNMPFETAGAAASGVVAALEVMGKDDITVVSWAGDGGTADIGLQALSGAAERGTNFIYICYDNEAYMNTGNQRSGATPFGALTTTTPTGKFELKKDMPRIMAAHDIPYIATACSAFPEDLFQKVKKAKTFKGPRYIHILSMCPTGWRVDSSLSIAVGRKAVSTGMWILYEIENGQLTLTGKSKYLVNPAKREPIEEYLKLQGRFAHITDEEIEQLKKIREEKWSKLLSCTE